MSDQRKSDFEVQFRALTKDFPYPQTPDIAGGFERRQFDRPRGIFQIRRLAWVGILLILVVASLVAVPSVRARLLEFLQIGSVRILFPQPTPTSSPTAEAPLVVGPPPTATPDYVSDLVSVLDLDGKTTLEEVQQITEFPIRSPTYPPELGEPDRVFYQQLDERAFVVLVWLHPDTDDQVWISLYALGEGTAGFKGEPRVLEETEVNGERAVWTDGPHFFTVDGFFQSGRLVESPVLIWTAEGLTYRLEADMSKEEMIRIAESLD